MDGTRGRIVIIALVMFIPMGLGALPHKPGETRSVGEASAAEFHPERLLVRFRANASRAAREAAHEAARVKGVVRSYHAVSGLQLVEVAEDARAGALSACRKDPNVLYAEPDYIICADIPNDPDFDKLLGLYNTGQTVDGDPGTAGADIQALPAWNFWTGSPTFRIAVIDTGVNYEHPDLQANMWTNPGETPDNGIDDDGNGFVDDVHGYDFYDEDGDPMDETGHGSHVSGTIGAAANNDAGVVGINWQCRIMSLRFLGGGG